MSVFFRLRGLALLLLTASAYAQHQRIALLAQEFKLAPQGSHQSEGYCLDKNLWAPTTPTTYSEVLSGGRRAVVRTPDGDRSLADAIRAGLLKVEVNGLNAKFIN